MSRRYDPNAAPDPREWQALPEGERLALVALYHRSAQCEQPPGPSPQAHAAIHAVVENQAALGDETAVAAALTRLVEEGLSRHEAVHAIGWVLSKQIYDLLGPDRPTAPDAMRARYDSEVRTLTAEAWLRSCSEAEGDEPAPIPTVGRNDPCPCGSGKKYKKCCLGKSSQ